VSDRRSGTALVTGVTGQDGVYLARALLADGFRVVGTALPGHSSLRDRRCYLDGVDVVEVDVRDTARVKRLVEETEPHEIYNLAAFSSVGRSWQQPEITHAVNTAPVAALVDGALALGARSGRAPRLFQASSAEVRGGAADSPYARSKAAAEDVVRRARDDHGLYAVCGILYNHESPLRGPDFVTRKITRAAAAIGLGRQDTVTLGNLDVERDWGFAGEYVDAMRRMLHTDDPVDVPVGTGVAHRLADLLALAFAAADVDDVEGRVVQDPALVRPADTQRFVADPSPARERLGWTASVTFEQLVGHMVAVDTERLRSGVDERPYYLWARVR
jgi:GDPmannose 4,6-dehydratase